MELRRGNEILRAASAYFAQTGRTADARERDHRAQPGAQDPHHHREPGRRAPRRSGEPAVHRAWAEPFGSCLDGAPAESFFATIKAEIGIDFWPGRANARRDIENWITQYNERRLHSDLGYNTPTETRRAWQYRMTTAA